MPPRVTEVRFPDYDDVDESDVGYLAQQNMLAQNMAVVAEVLRELERKEQISSDSKSPDDDLDIIFGTEKPLDESFDFSEIPRLQEALKALVETPSARELRESAARQAYAKKLAEDKQRADKASDQAGRLAALEQKADAMQTATRVGQPYGGQEPLKPKRSMLSSKDSKAMADEEEEE